MPIDPEQPSTGPGSPLDGLLGPEEVLRLFVQIQEDAKIKNGLALIKHAPAPE